MTRSTPTRRRSPARKTEISPRAVILAGIGAVSLGRKQAQAKLGQAESIARQTRDQAEAFVRDGAQDRRCRGAGNAVAAVDDDLQGARQANVGDDARAVCRQHIHLLVGI